MRLFLAVAGGREDPGSHAGEYRGAGGRRIVSDRCGAGTCDEQGTAGLPVRKHSTVHGCSTHLWLVWGEPMSGPAARP